MYRDSEEKLADFALNVARGEVPDEVVKRAKLIIADTLACIIRGYRTSYMRSVSRRFRLDVGTANLISIHAKSAPSTAALLNSSAGTVLELDEGHRVGGSHMAVQGLPAAIAVGQSNNISGRQLVRAFVGGYEVGVRVGWSLKPLRRGLHTHGTWAAVGAAVSSALAQPEFDSATVLQSIRIASNTAHSTTWKSAHEGALVRNFYAGLASMSGVIANTLAKDGVTGPDDAISSALAPAVSSTGSLQRDPAEGLGERYLMLDNYFKKYPCCGYTHSLVEALGKVKVSSPFDIERVDIRTFGEAAALSNSKPVNSLAAKFSIPYIVSNYFLSGELTIDTFADASVLRDSWRGLASKVHVSVDEAMEARYPKEWGSELDVVLKDGSVLRSACQNANPVSEEELRAKFGMTLAGVLAEREASSLWLQVQNLEKLSSIDELMTKIEESIADDYFS
ncbi:MAG: MmgE/PrpD family protein [Nitrososphaerota archaeon]|nr:MmgE/PrpD family protein [Nitrososphaerota archaeon]